MDISFHRNNTIANSNLLSTISLQVPRWVWHIGMLFSSTNKLFNGLVPLLLEENTKPFHGPRSLNGLASAFLLNLILHHPQHFPLLGQICLLLVLWPYFIPSYHRSFVLMLLLLWNAFLRPHDILLIYP